MRSKVRLLLVVFVTWKPFSVNFMFERRQGYRI